MRLSNLTVRAGVGVAGLLLAAGCSAQGAQDASPSGSTAGASPSAGTGHVMSDGSTMSGSQMDMHPSTDPSTDPSTVSGDGSQGAAEPVEGDTNGDGVLSVTGVGGQPSETAALICSDEVQDAVKRSTTLKSTPVPVRHWDGTTLTCSYPVDGAVLTVAVRDDTADSATTGLGYFRSHRRDLADARPIQGILNLGFPAYESRAGQVVFIKDHKTLEVDASALPASAEPAGFTREEVAYGVASAVLACWSE